jgi:hypothetical protein
MLEHGPGFILLLYREAFVVKTFGIYILFFIILSGVRLSPLGTSATTGLLYEPRMIDYECGAVGGT